MAKSSRNGKKRNGKPQSPASIALRSGIVPVRRSISPESNPVLRKARKGLRPEVGGAGKFYYEKDLSVTVVGFSRINNGDVTTAPKTARIIDLVESCSRPIEATIGGVGIFGLNNYKLAFHLQSDELLEEVGELEAAYASEGFQLGRDPLCPPDVSIVPHCTVANLSQQLGITLEDERERQRYDRIADVVGSTLILQAVGPSPRHRR